MKQSPAVFTKEFQTRHEFEAYRNQKKEWISSHKIELRILPWKAGNYAEFNLIACGYGERGKFDQVLNTVLAYDEKHRPLDLYMELLPQLTGRSAERVAHLLFWELIVKNPELGKQLLPVVYVDNMKETYPEVFTAWDLEKNNETV
jgi:hypothetical protein